MKSLALIAAASADKGIELYHIHKRSVDTSAYIKFIEELSALNSGMPIAIF